MISHVHIVAGKEHDQIFTSCTVSFSNGDFLVYRCGNNMDLIHIVNVVFKAVWVILFLMTMMGWRNTTHCLTLLRACVCTGYVNIDESRFCTSLHISKPRIHLDEMYIVIECSLNVFVYFFLSGSAQVQ